MQTAAPLSAALEANPNASATASAGSTQHRLIAYPKSGIDYCDQLYHAVAELGVEPVEGEWAGRWILANVRSGDVVHIHWPSFLYFQSGAPVATFFYLVRFFALISLVRMLGARIAWTAHNLYPHDGGRSRRVHRVARRFIVKVAEVVFVHGPTAALLVSREFGIEPRRIKQVPHGHWRALYPHIPERLEARRRVGLPEDVMLFGFVGSCRRYKNLESIMAAFPRVDDTSHLLIAGAFAPPEYFHKIRSMIDEKWAHRTHLVGRFLGDEEIMTYVSGLDALVLSYKDILTSGAVMLAFSAGIPVVAPRMGGLPDLIDDNCGVLYDPATPGALAEAMREVRRRSYSRDAIIAHAESFDWKVSARSVIELLQNETVSV